MSLSLEDYVPIKNLCNWELSFRRIDTIGDVFLPPNAVIRLTRAEIMAQVQSNNIMFAGHDGKGSHARIYIDDKPTRVELGFESDKEAQGIITDEKIKAAFAIKTKAAFEKAVKELAVTPAEKATLAAAVKRLKLNEHDKVRFIEEYTQLDVD